MTKWFKSLFVTFFIVAVAAITTKAAEIGEPAVADKGPHHRTIQRVSERLRHDGTMMKHTNAYVELATGLHYVKDGQWTESKEEIELFEGGAIARQGAHQVIWAPNINTAGAIDLMTPDGKRFRSHVLGLAYTDAGSGNSVMIAEIKDSIGQLIAPNQIVYPNAFTDFEADVRYTYTLAGFEQDIVLRQAPPSPADYGLNPETTRLEVYTEFLEAPVPVKRTTPIKRETNPLLRVGMAEPDLLDETLLFGAMSIGPGNAFPLNESEMTEVSVGKSWELREGRQLLIEKVEFRDIRTHLELLPQGAALKKSKEALMAKVRRPNGQKVARIVPIGPGGNKAKAGEAITKMAQASGVTKGFVLDYQQLTSDTNDFTFRADTTYYIRAPIALSGTTVLEGGTVIKATNGNSSSTTTLKRLWIQGLLDCRTDPYRPAIFTSKNDDLVGEVMSGSTGNPNTNYNAIYLDFSGNTNLIDVHDVRFRYANYGIQLNSSSDVTVRHAQFGRCYAGVVALGGKVRLRNVLMHDSQFAVGSTGAAQGEHMTCRRLNNLRSSVSMTLTNSLLFAVTNNLLFTGANVITNLSDAGVFQTVGAAEHYLVDNSAYRDAGTTNINPALLSDLKLRTTYPPIVVSNNITTNTTFSPQAQRDTALPDLGYHYDPLDFVLSKGLLLTNATLSVSAGTGIGVYGSADEQALLLMDGANLVIGGAADNLCHVVRYNLVQEQANTTWSSSSAGMAFNTPTNWDGTVVPAAAFRFADFAMPAGSGGMEHFRGSWLTMSNVVFKNCQFLGGCLYSDVSVLAFTNCLFERVNIGIWGNGGEFHNNTFYGGTVAFDGSTNYYFTDNLFDRTILEPNCCFSHNYNGYLVNSNRFMPTNATDVVLSSITYETGPLGRFYIPTNSPLINVGSLTNAGLVGLYHYTMTTNQVKETNSVVDIGFHYVAVSAGGSPIDSDTDSLADYIEDVNGDGIVDLGEADWTQGDTDGDGVSDYVEILQGRNPRAGANADTNGVLSLKVFTPLR